MVLIGFSQTHTFREYVREIIIEEVNSAIYGNLNIERIEGTLLTSFYLRNVSLSIEEDTVLLAKKIELKTSPLQLLLKRIYIRKFHLEDVDIKFLQNPDSTWNFTEAIKSRIEDEDTADTESEFTFDIIVNNFEIANLTFLNKSISFRENVKSQSILNSDDILLSNLNFAADIELDIPKNEYSLYLNNLSMKTNFGNFELLDFSGAILLTDKFVSIDDLYLLTNRSEMSMSARLDSFNVFSDAELENFRDYPLSVTMKAAPFNFDDLTAFIGSTDLLKGAINSELQAEGTFGDFTINKFSAEMGKTNLELTGRVKNLQTPAEFIVEASLENSNLFYSDALDLLQPLHLPRFKNLSMTNVSAYMQGEPTKFYSTIIADCDRGKINGDIFLNVESEDLQYDISIETEKLNVSPVTGIETELNSKIAIEGKGTSPDRWNANILCEMNKSRFNGHNIDSLTLSAHAVTLAADLELSGILNNSKIRFTGDVDYNDQQIPKYDLNGDIRNFNITEFTKDSSLNSNFNFDFHLNGEHTNLDSIHGQFVIEMKNSFFNNHPIMDSRVELSLSHSKEKRSIDLISDFADLSIYGNYDLSSVIDLIVYQSATVTDIIKNKTSDLNPFTTEIDSETKSEEIFFPEVINKSIEFNYRFNFKDLNLIALFMDIEELDIAGYSEGTIKNDSLNFEIFAGLYLDYLFFKAEDSYYLTDFEGNISFSRNNRSLSFDDLFGTLSITSEELFAGNKFTDIFSDVIFNQQKLYINSFAKISDDLSTEFEGFLTMSDDLQSFKVNRLGVNYKNLLWANDSLITISFDDEKINLKNLSLRYGIAVLTFQGNIYQDGNLELDLTAENIPGEVVGKYIFNTPGNVLKTDIDFSAKVSGSLTEPKINSYFKINDVFYEQTSLGKLSGNLDYSDGVFFPRFSLLDNENNIKMIAQGKLPVYIGTGDNEKYRSKEKIDLSIKTDKLNLEQFGNAIPFVSSQFGFLEADIKIEGDINNLKYSGYINMPYVLLRSTNNNLEYSIRLLTTFNNQEINIDEFRIENFSGTPYNGIISGRGKITLDGFNLQKAEIFTNGDLAVLGKSSRVVSPYVFGDLYIGTKNNVRFLYENGISKIDGSLLLKEMDLTYILGSTSATTNDDFIYQIIADSSIYDQTQIKIAQFVSGIEHENYLRNQSRNKTPFDFNLYLETENESRLEFIISKAANQKLIVYATGNMDFRTIDGMPNAQGEFKLQQGSKLEYIKTFQADGRIRFESDITDPYLDIIATYSTTYDFVGDGSTLEDIAVKMNIKGQVSNLGKNLAGNPENIGIYIGKRNIENNIKDQRYDMSDAFSVILVGKLKQHLTSSDNQALSNTTNTMLSSTTNSLLSSVLTNFVNSVVGDYVSDIQISNNDARNLLVSGKIKNIRYRIGTSTGQVNKTNLSIEYLFNPNFLIRLERKDPVVGAFAEQELINELGLKYKFEF